ncbi:MAG: LysM peptidoglycan-binding domain-containing protein [Treponema sp.]|nr:LysM peptidoglycan-binding domain-containing protein [Treponema sp.]
MKKIGIKLADGTFFPILEEGSTEKKEINLTTVKDNQTKVKVDLYRGEKSSIDEAEYLDTLEISKMKKHPNGEPNIGLEISLDEKNELSAKIVDKESGAESQVSLSLLSENKNGKKNSDAENSDEAEGVALAPAPENEATPTEEIAPDLDLPDFDFTQEDSDETNLGEIAEATAAEEIPAEENAAETTTTEMPAEENFSDDLPSLDELDLSLPESSEQDDAIAEDTATIASLPQDDDFSLDENVSEEPPSEENPSEDFAADLDLPDLDFPQDDAPTEEVVQDSALPDLDFPDLSFDEPDSSAPKNEIQNEPDSANDDLDFSDMDFELPNFGDTDFSSDEIDSNFDDEKKSATENSFGSFSENNSSSGALDFSDLYDDENDYGENSQNENQKFPVVVCVVCAIICVLALLAILFVAPTRFNSSGENQTQDSAQELSQDFSGERNVSELPPPPPEPVAPIAPPAKEDEIVVITETKNVVPDFPPPQEKKSAPKEIVYKIKWGDTLWDLSAAYYKNPWLYPKIARYNNIKNPDYIIAGSTIRIPEE